MPPATVRYTSCWPKPHARNGPREPRGSSKADCHPIPTTERRGVPSAVGATSAWISTSSGTRALPFPRKTAAPGGSSVPVTEEQFGRIGDFPAIRSPVISKTPISSVAPKPVLDRSQQPVLMRAHHPRNTGPHPPYARQRARTCDLTIFGDMTDKNDRRSRCLGVSGSGPAQPSAPA